MPVDELFRRIWDFLWRCPLYLMISRQHLQVYGINSEHELYLSSLPDETDPLEAHHRLQYYHTSMILWFGMSVIGDAMCVNLTTSRRIEQ